ncbi:MAG: hypothetical protein Q7W51_00605 [Coriobacteriia bacterium]|nr:hypothetical protein [Coriobacteriia bacterium]
MSASASAADRGASRPSSRAPIAILVALSALYLPLRYMMESESVSDALYNGAYLYGTALQIVLAAVIIAVAVTVGMKQSIGRQWLLIGVGVSLYALGDVTWTMFDLFLGIDPYPSIADVFYTAEYVFFVAAMVLAIRAYSGLVKTRTPIIIGATLAVIGVAIVYFVLLKPYIFAEGVAGLGLWGFVVSTLYPVGDIALMLAPAVALALVVRQLGAGRLARPWWLVVVGALVFALVDSFFVYAEWAGTGLTPAMDMGYVLANLLFACAALVAKDAYRVG